MRIFAALVLTLALVACSSTTYYSEASKDRRIVYGVDADGNALTRRPGEPPARASAATSCLNSRGCRPDEEGQSAADLNR